MLPEVGELVFSFVVGYMGVLEFLYVVRHLYHWGFRHNSEMRDYKSEAESLRKLQEQLKNAIAEAKEREALGLKAMEDGVVYKDGFRIDEDKKKIEELKEKVRIQEKIAERQREIEEELERQRKIEEETRRQLKKAEEEFRQMEEEKKREKQKAEEEKRKAEEVKRKAEEEEKRKAESAKRKAEDEKRRAEEEENKRKQLAVEEENMKKIVEAERKREEEQRRQEEEKENERKLLQAEREREEKQRQLEKESEKKKIEEQRRQEEAKENERKLIEAEKEREERQRQQEIEDEKIVQKLLEAERQRETEEKERQADLERENTAKLIAAEQAAILKQREQEENEENVQKLLKAERELELKKQEMEEEAANLQRLIEAEKAMEERQRKIDEEALLKLKNAQEEIELRQTFDANTEAEEEAFVKKQIGQAEQTVPQTVKTQYGQTTSDSLKPKSMLFPGVSEESSSAEPASSLQSSFSTQQSSEAVVPTDLHFDEYERQAPDGGEDMPSLQYSDDYLRSLDGIKNKPLVREDGSGRRRAFKKRRSSGSSTSSRESRASREEELKMFTSLEEEESENIRKGDSEYESIKYASEPNLKVGKQRRHKRSPAKDAKRDPNDKGSLEMLDEEDSNPWGEVKPENYKNTDFWKREKNLSIDEEQEEFDARQRIQSPSTAAVNIPKMSSFEEATKSQHQEAIMALKRQRSKDPEPIQEPDEESETKNVSKVTDARKSPAGSNSSPASASASISPALNSPEPKRENSLEAEEGKDRTPSPNTGLRRSPRVDEMREYEEKWKTENPKTQAEISKNPAIEVEYASDEEPMSPEHLMEGISDFYDFNASINPSRSRSRSRSKTPAVNRSVSLPERRTPSPLNCSHIPARSKSRSPSPDPASYKFIVQRIIPSLEKDPSTSPTADHGLSDFYDFNTKLNREVLPGATMRRIEVHRTSVDYVLEDLRNEETNDGEAISKQIEEATISPTTPEYERSVSAEMRDVQKLKEEVLSGNFKRSTYVGESMDFSDEFEYLREEAKTFRRSRSRSRSPVYDGDINEMTARVLQRKQLQEKILEDITKGSVDSEQFSAEIMKNVVDRNRRASDTALIQKPEILFQIQDLIEETDENFNILNCEPEEYHHFRRFSLGQEIPVETYPEDYTYISEIEIKSLADLKDLNIDLGELQGLESLQKEVQIVPEEIVEEAYESGSDDERQTVVEVDDEIDEDIWEYNEKPAEESHNEQSECEEADREMDRYAGRNADDWRDVEGAVGGVSDEDSFQIDQIYDEAIKNRKPSGILRDYDSILKEIQVSDEDRLEDEQTTFSINGNNMRNLEPGLWSPQSRSSRASSRDSSRSFIEYERRDNEMRYLADPTMSAINSTRLRSRYGIVPSTSLPTGFEDDDVDLNYVPKKEYNWRKNFKLDDDSEENKNQTQNQNQNQNQIQYLDLDSRKFSLGGESITIFSQSREHSVESDNLKRSNEDEEIEDKLQQESEELEKSSKKKKNRRKSRKGSKGSIDEEKESVTTDGDSAPKRKNRRESKKNVVEIPSESEKKNDLPSVQQEDETESSQSKKKLRKHKKAKEEIVLPKLDIVIPTPEKKAPPPSVAALRAALSAPPPVAPEKKSPPVVIKPKKLWEKSPSISDKQSSTTESKDSPTSIRSSISPKPAMISQSITSSVSPQPPNVPSAFKENGVANVTPLKTKTLESTHPSSTSPEISPLRNTVSPSSRTDLPPKKEEKQDTEIIKSEISETQKLETKSTESVNPNTQETRTILQSENKTTVVSETTQNKSELSNSNSILEPPSAESIQNQSSDISKTNPPNTEILDLALGASNIKQSENPLDSDILKDGGLYPLF